MLLNAPPHLGQGHYLRIAQLLAPLLLQGNVYPYVGLGQGGGFFIADELLFLPGRRFLQQA